MNKRNVIITIISVLILTCLFAYARTTTTDLVLVKPTWTENVDILDDINANSDLLEAFANDVLEHDLSPVLRAALDIATFDIEGVDATEFGYLNGISSFGGTLIDDANASAARTTLELAIGVNIQAYDDALTSISALTYVSPSFVKLTANDTYAVRTLAETKTDLSLNLVENTALSTWVGASSITTLGTISTGAWNGDVLAPAYGGTGVANGANNTITFTGNYTLGLTLTANTALTAPTSGTLATLAGTETLSNKNITDLDMLNFADATELTIATGAITVTQSYHKIDTETDAGSDELTTISGGTAGDVIYLCAENDARTVVLKHDDTAGAGKIVTSDGNDYSLDDDNKVIQLVYNSVDSHWHMVGAAGGGAGETNTASNVGTGAEVYKQKTGVDFELRKIEAGSNQIDIHWFTEDSYVLKESYTTDGDNNHTVYGVNWRSQQFTTTDAYNIKKVSVHIKKAGSPPNMEVSIRAVDGAGKPTGADLASGTIASSSVGAGYAWVDCVFDSLYGLSSTTQYVVLLKAPTGDASNKYYTLFAASGTYANNCTVYSTNSGSTWTVNTSYDMYFKTYEITLVYNDQIEIDVNEENIRLDDLKATEDNTDLNASTSAHGLMPKLPFSGDLLSTTTVAFNANADTTLYTVPAGKRCVLSHAIIVAAGDAGATTTVSIGQNTAETDFVPANTLSNLDAQYDSVILQPIPNTTPLKIKSYAAATVIEAQVANQSGVVGNTIYLFGILY